MSEPIQVKRRRDIKNGTDPRIYKLWHSMKTRCSNWSYKNQPRYQGCTVHPDWLDFDNFHAWVVTQYGHDLPGWQLDKDILVRGNKVYGPNTCVFVPKHVNGLFSNIRSKREGYPCGVRDNESKIRPYGAVVEHRGKGIGLGVFETKEAAFAAYKAKKEEIFKAEAEALKPFIRADLYAAMVSFEIHITD